VTIVKSQGVRSRSCSFLAARIIAAALMLVAVNCGDDDPTTPAGGPVIDSLSPQAAPPGAAGFIMSVHGSRFTTESVARWDGANRATTYIDATRLMLDVPDSALVHEDSIAVTVLTPGGFVSNAASFRVAGPPFLPTIKSVFPSAATAEGNGFVLYVSGYRFKPNSVFHWGDADRSIEFLDSTMILTLIEPDDIAAGDTVPIAVFNPGPEGGRSNARQFVISYPAPTIDSLTPPSARVGSGGTELVVDGSGFVSRSEAIWNDEVLKTTVISGSRLVAIVPATAIAEMGSANVSVRNPSPGGGSSNAQRFVTYIAIDLEATDMIYDPLSQHLYVASQKSAMYPNSVVAIEPRTGSIAGVVPVGLQPSKLAISSDGKFMYVGLDGEPLIQRIDMSAQSVDFAFGLGEDPMSGPHFAKDIAVLPGMPTSVAVARRRQHGIPDETGVAVFDVGQKRLAEALVDEREPNLIVFADSTTLFGYDTNTTAAYLARLAVDSEGVHADSLAQYLVFSAEAMVYFDGRLYFDRPQVVDARSMTVVGQFSNFPQIGARQVCIHQDTHHLLVTQTQYPQLRTSVVAMELETLTRSAEARIEPLFGIVKKLVAWGDDGVAFAIDSQIIVLRADWLSF